MVQTVSQLLEELKSHEGKTIQELAEEVDAANRRETREELRKLRVELVAHVGGGTEIALPNDLTPSEMRRCLFSSVWERGCGFITAESSLFQPSAEEFYKETSDHFGIDRSLVEQYLFADTPEQRRVVFRSELSEVLPHELVKLLNLERLKRMLRRTIRVTVLLPGKVERGSPYVALLWSLKRNHLMYEVREERASLVLAISGPYSLFGKTTVYGNRLADFVKTLLQTSSKGISWEAEAELMACRVGGGDSMEVLHLSSTMNQFFPRPVSEQGEEKLKSGDEAAFRRYFEREESGWDVHYEGAMIPLRSSDGTPAGFFIPDFVVRDRSSQREVLIEIVGYWREEYLRRKVEKVKLVKDRRMFLVVNANLALGKGELEPAVSGGQVSVLFYTGRAGLKRAAEEIIRRLTKEI
ncbi:MAG: DUF790 family protein [Bacteroidota bacterium]